MTIKESIEQLEEVIDLFKRGLNIRINPTDIKALECLIKAIKEVQNDKNK